MKNKLGFLTVLGAVTFSAVAGELTVAKDGTGDYVRIQDAIDAANAGDTIWVKPGIYDEGGKAGSDSTVERDCVARLCVDKQLQILATSADPADTHIVGRADPNPVYEGVNYGGRGPDAVRCVYISKGVATASESVPPTIIKGFTIRDGYCRQYYNGFEGGDVLGGRPGGVASFGDSLRNFYVVDCVISNCFGVRGGLVRGGNYVRCRFGKGNGNAGQDLGRSIKAMSCLFLEQSSSCLMSSDFVNCTFADSKGSPVNGTSANADFYNSIVAESPAYSTEATTCIAKNSVLQWMSAKTHENCHVGLAYQLFAPLRGDFRVRAGTAAATAGDAALIDEMFPGAPEIVDIRKSMDGTYFAKSGVIAAGCYATPVKAAGGAVLFAGNNPVKCNGYTGSGFSGGLYAFSETPYEVFQVTPPDGVTHLHYVRDVSQGGNQYPEMDESLWVAVPPEGTVVTNTAVVVAQELWIDPQLGDDQNDGKSSSAPMRTFARCREVLGGNSTPTLVHCAAGTYNEKGYNHNGDHTSRLCISHINNRVRFKGAGRGKSIIAGCPDQNGLAAGGDGRGPDAMRCVYLCSLSTSCVQGFTLQDGYSDDGTEDGAVRQGGLVWMGSGGGQQICDCELVGGVAYRGSCAMNGRITRSILRNCQSLAGGGLRNTKLFSCIVTDCSGVFINSDLPAVYQVTIDSVSGNVAQNDARITNSVINVRANAANLSGEKYKSVYYMMNGSAQLTKGTPEVSYIRADLCIADAENDDFRMLACSPVFTEPFAITDDYWCHTVTDVHGVPFCFKGGKVTVGAVQTPVQTVVVSKPNYGSSTSVGTNIVEQGQSVTVEYSGVATRKLEGILVNGELTGGNSFTYVAGNPIAGDGSPVPSVNVSFLFSTNWYVNAVSGNDDNDGFTPETPWKSLAKISESGIVVDGDCVHVSRGNYDDKAVYGGETAAGLCRVCVPSGVTVVADEGALVTRIVGAGDASSADSYKRGANAVRCAYLNHGSRIINFTLADGRVSDSGSGEGAATCGGGFYSTQTYRLEADCGAAVGCVITNCAAARGGAAYKGALFNCKIVDCIGVTCTAAGYNTAHFGCYIDHIRRGDASSVLRNSAIVSHCTIGSDITAGRIIGSMNLPAQVDNCVILSTITDADGSLNRNYQNCVLVMSEANWAKVADANKVGSVRLDSAADAGLDAQSRPLRTSGLIVDKAIAVDSDVSMPAQDADGNQRVYNGAMDIGAFEYDWRSDYAAMLGNVGSVVSADPQVEATEDGVLVKRGTLAFRFADDTMRARYSIPLCVTGTGCLTVNADEVSIGDFSADDGEQVLPYRNKLLGNDLSFAYVPGEIDAGGALLRMMSGGAKGTVVIVH